MIDPNSAPQVIQQMHPSWFDWIAVGAIIVGPILALSAQRLLDRIREKKNRRVQLYLTAMSLRAAWLHPDSIRALNSIDTIFDKDSDKPVRAAWAAVVAQAYTPKRDATEEAAREWNARLEDLRVGLYQVLGAAVGYDHTIDYIKRQFYNPQAHVDIELELMQIRKQFLKALGDDGLKVVVKQGD